MDKNETGAGDNPADSARQLSRKTLHAAGWNYVSFGLGKLSVMVTMLARLLGPDWVEAIPVMRLIAVSSLIFSIGTNVSDVYKAVGRPGILWKPGIVNVMFMSICLVVGVRYGLIGGAVAHIIAALQVMS
jgi:lipopolysaccharide exporter